MTDSEFTRDQKFRRDVKSAIDDFVEARLMHKIDNLAQKHDIGNDNTPRVLRSVRDTLDLDTAWQEYVE